MKIKHADAQEYLHRDVLFRVRVMDSNTFFAHLEHVLHDMSQ